MHGLMELLDCLDDLASFCTVLCVCPLDVGIICVFYALFRLPNVGQECNEHCLFVNVILLCAICPVTCTSLGRTCTVLPVVSKVLEPSLSKPD